MAVNCEEWLKCKSMSREHEGMSYQELLCAEETSTFYNAVQAPGTSSFLPTLVNQLELLCKDLLHRMMSVFLLYTIGCYTAANG